MNYPDVDINKNIDEVISGADAVVIFTGHKEYFNLKPDDITKMTGMENSVIINGRNSIDLDMFINVGFVYKKISRGDKNGQEIIN